ncbi:hypothetical protein ACFUTX_16410 [Microbacterium sp. NPDC057407]
MFLVLAALLRLASQGVIEHHHQRDAADRRRLTEHRVCTREPTSSWS